MAVKLGPSRPIPNKKFPNKSFGTPDLSLIMSEKEKEKNDFEIVKSLVDQYEQIGSRQIAANKDKIIKMYNLANGVIDKRDYVKDDTEHKSELELMDGEDLEFDLEFYPIIPNIVNVLSSFPSKTKIGYSATAVNREAQNEVLEQKNNSVRGLLVSKSQEIFNAKLGEQGITEETQPDVYKQQLEIFQALPKIQKYYNTEYRLTIEEWANHRLENDKQKHSLPDIEKKVLFNKIVCDRPYVHINLQDTDYRPEVLKADDCAYLKSPYINDVSEGYMFMWYEYDSPTSLIQKFGDKMSEEDMEKIEDNFGINSTRFTLQTRENFQFETSHPIEATVQNYLAFRNEYDNSSKHRGDEYRDNLIEVLNMYLQIPRKLYKLTMISDDGSIYSTIVDENYKITFQPKYIPGKEKMAHNLIFGEHLDPFYKNELWRVIKINFTRNPNPKLDEDIWLVLEKYPIQLSNPNSRYGSYIPVHGGPTTNEYSESNSIVGKCESWQIFYNYLWNRASQLLQTELGVFFLMNQNAIPQESMGESWGKHNLLKWALTARDTQIAPMDLSPTNTGGTNLNATGGFGQKVDLTRTEEVLQKIQLAEVIKNECLSVVGISPQLLGDISPNETATGVMQGVSRSIAALKNIYDEHFSMMTKVRQTMLECAKYIAIEKGSVEETYINSEGERVIFQTDTENFPLYQMGIFVTSNFDDNLLLFEIKEMVKRDNTMGADALDKISILAGNSVSEIFSKLQDLQRKRENQQRQQQAQIQEQEQAKIESAERLKQEQLAWEREKLAATLASNERIADIKVISSSQFGQGGGVEELVKLEGLNLNQKEYYQNILDKARNRQLTQEDSQSKQEQADSDRNQNLLVEQEKAQLKREELATKLKISNNELAIAKENKP